MASSYITKRLFKPKRGIDLKSPENLRGEDYLTNAQNVIYDGNGNLCKRNGFQLRVYGADAFSGLMRIDTTDYAGDTKSELLIIGNSGGHGPQRIVKNTLSLTNTLVGVSVTVTVYYDEATLQYRMTITGGVSADIALGTGIVGGDPDMTALIAILPGVITGVASGSATTPAAFLGIKQVTIQAGSTETFEYFSAEEITYGGKATEPTTTVQLPRNNPSYATVNGCVYWYKNHTGDDYNLYKYDGHSWYKAGLPSDSVTWGAHAATGATITDSKGTRTFTQPSGMSYDTTTIFARYSYKDNIGVTHNGEFKDLYVVLGSSGAEANGGYPLRISSSSITTENARAAKVNGDQATVNTITVDNGHGLVVGDVAYFWDGVSSSFVEREVTEIAATTVKVAGSAVTVNNNAIISNNFRIQYFKASQTSVVNSYYSMTAGDLFAEAPYNCLDTDPDIYLGTDSSTQTDYGVTGLAKISYLSSGYKQYPPPLGRFVASTANGSSLLVAGDSESDNTVYSSLMEDCEAFYLGRNSFTVDEKITGLGSSGSVAIIGTENKTFAVTGDIPNLNFRVEKITDNLGIKSHASIEEIDEGTIVFNTHKGMFSMSGGRQLAPVGEWPTDKRISIIEPYFSHRYSVTDFAPQFSVSNVSVIKEKKIIINATPSYYGTTFGPNANISWVYDYSMGGWFVWAGVDLSLGCVYWDDKMWALSHGASSKVDLYSMNETGSVYDYSDHGTAIDAVVQYHWEAAGDSNLYKKFNWITIYTPPGNGVPYELNVKTWANYEIEKVTCFTNPLTQHTSFSKYSDPPAYTIEAKLRTGKMVSMMLEISNDSANEGMWIGGTEVDISPSFGAPSRSGRSDR